MNKKLLILGAGGHARVVADCALAMGIWSSIAFLDDRYPELSLINDWPAIGRIADLESFISEYSEMALGVGVSYESLRLELIIRGQQVGAKFPAIIHPSATISPFSKIGEGSVVFAGVVINVNASIGSGCIINTASSIDHDCLVGDGSHISPGALLAGGVTIGEKAWVGMGAKVLQCISVGPESVIGAGAVVLSDVPANSKAVGVPAKLIS
ncbi:acetyltransferase [uncultured Endozoicomonas sp.]|uniref:acetyltransferase n=1 Tax=uncultured Endozoicomonas sp. TaxID=432652 RepID=UPI00262F94EE|nr:acetyltransferase [uncultured Endozoicomonas sp.]